MATQLLLPDGGWSGTGYLLPGAGVASASSSGFAASASNITDRNITSLWRPSAGCDPGANLGPYCCEPEWVQLTVPSTSVLGGIVIRAPRSIFSGGGRVLTGRLEFMFPGVALPSRDIVLNPAGDWAFQFLNVISGAGTIRFRPGWSETPNAGVAEIELYAP